MKRLAVVVVLTALGGAVWLYNTYTDSQEAVITAWNQVRNVEQRRMDLIPQLVAVTEAYAEHERAVTTELARARAEYLRHAATPGAVRDLERIDTNLGRVVQAVERYPQLHASELYRTLRFELLGTENRIAVERQRYNAAAAKYRSLVRKFPLSLLPLPLSPPALFSRNLVKT